MQCVILAAGFGSRMGDLTKDLPKPMLKVKERPILEYKMHALPQEITEIVLVVGYQCHHIMNYFGTYFAGRPVRYALQTELNGTAGAMHIARPFLGERFMVLMGDDFYTRHDLQEIVAHDLAILGCSYDNVKGKGIITAKDGDKLGGVTEAHPYDEPGLVNAAAYMLTQDFFDYAPASANNGHAAEIGLPQTLAQMTDKHDVKIHEAKDWMQVSAPEDLQKAAQNIHNFL